MINGKKVAGIVCEYNPFHNGHKYHIEETKKQTGCEYIVCAMSGSMVQRGEAAICDKWQRAATAINNGADLVIEIPAYYVLQSAQNYAYGSVALLDALGVTDTLAFGSESGDVNMLRSIADILTDEPLEYSASLNKAMDSGLSYPAACEAALKACVNPDFKFTPNDILAVNYIKALNVLKSNITPHPIKRTTDYHSADAENNAASATAVRNMIKSGDNIAKYVPEVPATTYDMSNLSNLVLGFFRTAKAETLSDIVGMEDGLANRLISCAKSAVDYESFVNACITKRYTRHRIQRVIMCCLLGIQGNRKSDYVRILAMNDKGRELLTEIKRKSMLSIITKTADFTPDTDSMFCYDILATDIAALCCNDTDLRIASKDYTTSPYIQKKSRINI